MLGGFFANSAFAQQNTKRADDTPLKLTLHDALQIAVSDNPTVRVAEQEVKKTTYAKNKAWAALFPKVDLNGNYSYTIKKQKMYFGGMKFPGMGGSPGGNGGNNDQNSSANNAIAIEVGVRHSIKNGHTGRHASNRPTTLEQFEHQCCRGGTGKRKIARK